METKKQRNGGQVDLTYLFKVLKNNVLLILVVAVLCGGVAGVYRELTTQKTYTSQVSFFVNGVATNSSGQMFVTGSSASTAQLLTEAFAKIMKQNRLLSEVAQKVAENGVEEELTAKDISGMINVRFDTQNLDVSVTHPDPNVAFAVAQALTEVVPGWFNDLLNLYQTETEDDAKDQYLVQPTSDAELDKSPSGKGTLTVALLGAVVGAAAVYLVCYVKAVQDHTIYDEKNLQEHFSMPIVGQIPTWEDDDRPKSRLTYKRARAARKRRARAIRRGETGTRVYTDRLLSNQTPFAVAEAFKVLRTNMCYTTKGEKSPVYGVTSSYVGAGKSVVSSNAAIAFAQMGKRVLLIDGDMRCPVQHKIFGVSSKTEGLSELLAGVQSDKSRVILPTAVPGLDVIVAGHEPPNPAELLASVNMTDLIGYAREQYDVVFIDLPPVGVVADAGVIGDLVTGYVLVVRSAYSDRKEVQTSISTMEKLGAHLIGFVLNDVDLKGKSNYRNGYYGSYDNYVRRSQRGKDGTPSDAENA